MKATICNKCGTVCATNDNPAEYHFYCPECKEGLYDFETTNVDTDNMIPGKSYHSTNHMGMSIEGFLRNYKNRKMTGLMTDDNGREMSDKECRDYLAKCQVKGWKLLPMCGHDECPDFDRFENGCPGHLKRVVDSTQN